VKRTAVDNELHRIVKHMWDSLGQMLAVFVATLAEHVPEQNAALCGIDQIFRSEGGSGLKRQRREALMVRLHPSCSHEPLRFAFFAFVFAACRSGHQSTKRSFLSMADVYPSVVRRHTVDIQSCMHNIRWFISLLGSAWVSCDEAEIQHFAQSGQ